MTKKLLTSNSPEAIALVEALGFKALNIYSIEFKLVAGELALISTTSYLDVDTAERFVKFFEQFNLVPVATPVKEESSE